MKYIDETMDVDIKTARIQQGKNLKLTDIQEKASQEILEHIGKQSVFVDAVCGAGKTEICIPVLRKLLRSKLKVGWAIPRREVVIELAQRIQMYLGEYLITPVYGGCSDNLYGDIIVCTTHQLFRYPQYFDVLVIDEPDAFPFANDDVLERFSKLACRGSILYLSATYSMDHIYTVTVPIRPSGVHLPVPTVRLRYFPFIALLLDLNHLKNEMVLIFVPTVKIGEWLSKFLSCPLITSNTNNKEHILADFRIRRNWIVCTTILERGVTFTDCFVCVYEAQHHVFTEASLIQISGRAMRGMRPLKGDVKFYCREYSDALCACINRIKDANNAACSVFKR